MQIDLFTRLTSAAADISGRPITFTGMLGFVMLWGLSGPYFYFSDTWQLVINTSTTIITCLLAFLIQASANRSELAIQTKLDEILLALHDKKTIGSEHLTLKELSAMRKSIEEIACSIPNKD